MLKAFFVGLLVFSSVAVADSKIYTVEGMHCEDCAKKIEAELCPAVGAQTCKVEMGKVTLVSKKPLDDAKVTKLIKKSGHYKVTDSKIASEVPAPTPEAQTNK